MASQLKVDTITGVTTAGSVAVTGEGNSTTTNLQQGLVKAWINLNGTGTIATRDSFNSASITDNGTGEYIDTFTNPMVNTTYSVSGESGTLGANNENMFVCNFGRSTTGSRGSNMSDGGSAADRDLYCIMVAGDLA